MNRSVNNYRTLSDLVRKAPLQKLPFLQLYSHQIIQFSCTYKMRCPIISYRNNLSKQGNLICKGIFDTKHLHGGVPSSKLVSKHFQFYVSLFIDIRFICSVVLCVAELRSLALGVIFGLYKPLNQSIIYQLINQSVKISGATYALYSKQVHSILMYCKFIYATEFTVPAKM